MATTVLEKARMKTAVGRECVKGSRAGGNKSMKRTLSSSFRSYAVGKSPRNQDCGPTTSRTSLDAASNHVEGKGRRQSLLLAGSVVTLLLDKDTASLAAEGEFENSMEALKGKDYGKSKMRFSDYTLTESGLQYQDIRTGTGPSPKQGEEVVVDWDGYTIGYYGRIFEARNKPKGSSFEGNDRGYFRFHVGQDEVIPAFDEAIATMKVGGIRRIIVPSDIGYPENDWHKKEPKPSTFAGKRSLSFVLQNQGLIDKTLLFDIELIKISK